MSHDRHPLLDAQIAYYDARAAEYERSLGFSQGRFDDRNEDAKAFCHLQEFVRALPPVESTLEFACGTGIWTRELLKVSDIVHAVDSSATMIELNRLACDVRVTYECADIFEWTPSRRFDRVAGAFWLSHVPEALLATFVHKIDAALRPSGQVLIIDEAVRAEREYARGCAARELADGSRYEIVKVCRSRAEISEAFAAAGYGTDEYLQSGRLIALLMSSEKSLER